MAKLGEAAADLTAQMPHCHALCQARGLCNSDDCLCISAEPLAIAQLGQGHPLRCDTLGKLDVHRAKRGGAKVTRRLMGHAQAPRALCAPCFQRPWAMPLAGLRATHCSGRSRAGQEPVAASGRRAAQHKRRRSSVALLIQRLHELWLIAHPRWSWKRATRAPSIKNL